MATVRGIGDDDFVRLGVDEHHKLYWDGKPVVTEERLTLTWWVNIAVVVGALSTFAMAVFEALKFFR
jgi:hypothetical protein